MPDNAKRCTGPCGAVKPLTEFSLGRGKPRAQCKRCCADAQAKRDRAAQSRADAQVERDLARVEERARRVASDHDALRPEDFDDEYDTSVANDRGANAGRVSAKAAREKRQEFSKAMGETAEALRSAAVAQARGDGDVLSNMPGEVGTYIAKVAEQERRFGNRRLARSVSLAMAQEQLALRQFKLTAEQFLSDKVTPTGYARKERTTPIKRSVCLLLSDLHLGAELDAIDEPMPFRAVEEARRLEYVLRQALDYKPQYRSSSELVLLLDGDIIEGYLEHDLRAGAPLAEQKVIFWRAFRSFVGLCAQQYPSVRVVCQSGNHGRDKVRHPGRATARKWDGHEWEMYVGLQMMCSSLRNVTWQIDLRAVSIVDLHGSKLGLTHGDTEVKLGHPDGAASKNAAAFDRINATRIHGVEFDAWAIGHFHTPRFHPMRPRVIYNGALVPPNGHARASGYVGERCGQFMWEAVEGFPVGDLRFIEVGPAQDGDKRLGTLIEPFRLPLD